MFCPKFRNQLEWTFFHMIEYVLILFLFRREVCKSGVHWSIESKKERFCVPGTNENGSWLENFFHPSFCACVLQQRAGVKGSTMLVNWLRSDALSNRLMRSCHSVAWNVKYDYPCSFPSTASLHLSGPTPSAQIWPLRFLYMCCPSKWTHTDS